MRDVCFYGWGNSELDKFAEQAGLFIYFTRLIKAREEGRYISRELKPEDGLFFRSDHYCFCKKKVPGIPLLCFNSSGMFLAWSSDVIGQNREDVVKVRTRKKCLNARKWNNLQWSVITNQQMLLILMKNGILMELFGTFDICSDLDLILH